MTKPIQCDIYIAMNESGDWYVAQDDGDVADSLESNDGGCMRRIVKVVVWMTPPTMGQIEVAVPDEAGTTTEAAVADEAA